MTTHLDVEQIVDANRRTIIRTGGFVAAAGRVLNRNSLEYLAYIVHARIDDQELYPSLADKAAVYAYHIITRHVFFDGNKRTGTTCAFWFLELNGCGICDSTTEDEIVELAVGIANGVLDLDDVALWIQDRLVQDSDSS